MTGETGSYRYMAPEVFRHEPYSEKVDIYSLGCIMFYLFHGEAPFEWLQPLDACRAAAVELKRPALRPTLAPELAQLLAACWDPEPDRRPHAKAICERLERIFPDVNEPDKPFGCACSVV